MYYYLCNSEVMTTYVEAVNQTHQSLISGIEINEVREQLPYIFTYDEPDHHPLLDIVGESKFKEMKGVIKECGEDHLWDFFDADHIMSKKMYSILQTCGVNNIQIFPLQFINNNTEETRDDYIVFNVLGLVPCTKIIESETLPFGEVFYEFAGSLIDPKKTNDLLFFRKELSDGGLYVHETVATKLKDNNIKGVSLIPTRKWQRQS